MSLEDLTQHYSGIIEGVGENLQRDGLLRTPERAAKAIQFLCRGYNQTLEEVVNEAIFETTNDDMVIVKDIELYSLCEHHILPFIGKAHVAYLPRGKVIGLSKIARIVDMYARRLQIQENMTVQIADAIEKAIEAGNIGPIIVSTNSDELIAELGAWPVEIERENVLAAGLILAIAWFVGTHELSVWAILALAITAGSYSGLGINTAHELGHKKTTIEQTLAKITLMIPAYGHF